MEQGMKVEEKKFITYVCHVCYGVGKIDSFWRAQPVDCPACKGKGEIDGIRR